MKLNLHTGSDDLIADWKQSFDAYLTFAHEILK